MLKNNSFLIKILILIVLVVLSPSIVLAMDGDLLWSSPSFVPGGWFPYANPTASVLYSGNIYTAGEDGFFAGISYGVPYNGGKVEKRDASSGAPIWTINIGQYYPQGITVDGTGIYILSYDISFNGFVHKVNSVDGSIIWSRPMGAEGSGGITASSDAVFVAGPSSVYKLNAASGEVVWSKPFNSGANYSPTNDVKFDGISSIYVASSHLLSGSVAGYLEKRNVSDGTLIWGVSLGANKVVTSLSVSGASVYIAGLVAGNFWETSPSFFEKRDSGGNLVFNLPGPYGATPLVTQNSSAFFTVDRDFITKRDSAGAIIWQKATNFNPSSYGYPGVGGRTMSATADETAVYFGTATYDGPVASYPYRWLINKYSLLPPPVITSVSVSPNPVPYYANPGFSFTSQNASVCEVVVDWDFTSGRYVYGSFTSGTFYLRPNFNVPGDHELEVSCWNSSGDWSGWSFLQFHVNHPDPYLDVLYVSPNPVTYGGVATISAVAFYANYCYVYIDWGPNYGQANTAWAVQNFGPGSGSNGSFGGSYNTLPFLSPGVHEAELYCTNVEGIGLARTASFTVSPAPVNCSGYWSNNSTCSLSCGGGVLQQTYTLTQSGANGGDTSCPATGATRWGSTSCNTQSCAVSGACNNGSATYPPSTLSCSSAPGGQTGPTDNGTYWSITCNGNGVSGAINATCTQPKIIDGGWSGWSPASCPTACGQPASTQTRTCSNPSPTNGGATCPGSSSSSCSATAPCPVNGACSTAHYSCLNSTTSGSNAENTSTWTWSCNGLYGGSNAPCSENKPTFTITASAGSGGAISSPGVTTVYMNNSRTYSITPLTGYSISSVLVDGANQGAISSYTFPSVTSNRTISASFTINSYSMTARAYAGGSISGPSSATYGSSPSYTITPYDGYSIAGIYTNGINYQGTSGSYTFPSITGPNSIDAYFVANSYTISFNSSGGTSVSSITQAYGSTVSSPANPTKTGYTFTGWSPPLPPTMPAYNQTLTAQWSTNSYLVTWNSATGGTSSGAATCVYGTTVIPTCNPYTGYSTVSCSNFTCSTSNSFTPSFSANPCGNVSQTWSTNCTASTGSASSGQSSAVTNTNPAYTGSATYSCFAGSWGGPTGASCALNYYTISTSVGTNGYNGVGGTISNVSSVSHGSTATYTITAYSGYSIGGIYFNGTYQTNSNSYTTPGINSNGNYITVIFVANSYTYNFTSAGTAVPSITQVYGSTINPPSNPTRTGYTFTGWSPGIPSTMPAGGGTSVAQWTINSYTVSTSAGANGSISPTSASVNHGSGTSFTISSANSGYTIASASLSNSNASGSGTCVGLTSCTYSVSNVTGATTLGATFVPVATVTISSSLNPITVGGSTVLSWTPSNASSCTASGGWSGTKSSANGSYTQTVTPGSTTSYSIQCTNSAGAPGNIASVTVTVVAPPSITSFSATPNPVSYNSNTTVSWASSGTSGGYCYLYLDGNYGSTWATGLSGSQVLSSITTGHSILLSCFNAAASNVQQTLNIGVNGACGSSSGQEYYTAPTTGLCVNGSTPTVSGSGPWSWTCLGNNGGSNSPTCSAALKNYPPVATIDSPSPPIQIKTNSSATPLFFHDVSMDQDGSIVKKRWYKTADCTGAPYKILSPTDSAFVGGFDEYYTNPTGANVTYNMSLQVEDNKGDLSVCPPADSPSSAKVQVTVVRYVENAVCGPASKASTSKTPATNTLCSVGTPDRVLSGNGPIWNWYCDDQWGDGPGELGQHVYCQTTNSCGSNAPASGDAGVCQPSKGETPASCKADCPLNFREF